ncbi:MAG: PilZ domain-containing protein [Magnetococcales bacterium]|nr:PilZ domain-containing protein [Magnetococcales bacterium]
MNDGTKQDPINRRNFNRISCSGDVTVNFPGNEKITGTLRDISTNSAFFSINFEFDVKEEMVGTATIKIDDEKFFSSGYVIRIDASGFAFRLHSGAAAYKHAAGNLISQEASHINRIFFGQQIHKIIEESSTGGKADKINCWEYKKCGNEKICAAACSEEHNGKFGGKSGGRFCTFIDGTISPDGIPWSSKTEKLAICSKCSFYKLLMDEVFQR